MRIETGKEIDKLANKEGDYFAIKEGVFHASECGLCPRVIYLSRVNPKAHSKELKRIFLVGDLFHKFFQEGIFKDYNCEKEVTWENENFKILGRVDCFNDEEVVDFKTCKETKYMSEPKEENVVQINIYMKILGIHKGRLIYIGKNMLDIKEFDIDFSEELFTETIDKLDYISKKLKCKTELSSILHQPSPNCYYCQYVKLCYPKLK